jgi:hypothetical protein
MRTFRIGTLGLAALCASAIAIPAQAEEQATFHLPVRAHWGAAVLEPGDYRVALPAPSVGRIDFQIIGGGKSLRALPQVTDVRRGSKTRSQLVLAQIDGTYFVREFSSQSAGKAFLFAVPKSRGTQVAKSANQALPVTGGSQPAEAIR